MALLLRGLDPPFLRGFRAGLEAQSALLDAEILKQQSRLLKNDVLALQVDALAAIVNEALDQAEASLAFFPTGLANLIAQCASMGAVQVAPDAILETIREIAAEILQRARELASFSEELAQLIQALQALKQLLEDMINCILDTIVELEAPPAA